jgi:hypothetical protein
MNEDYEIPKISENSGGMPCINPKWTWMYAEFEGKPAWLMTPDIKPLNCCDLLFVIDGDNSAIHLYACTYHNPPTELWCAWGHEAILVGYEAVVGKSFPQIAQEFKDSLKTIPLWMAQDPFFTTNTTTNEH